MKRKIFKILGVAITLGIVLSLVFAGLPVNAAVEKINEWYTFDYPVAGSAGDWFRQGTGSEAIDAIGPMAEAINGDLYAYVELGVGYTDHLFKSTDGGRTWAATGYEELDIVPDIEGDPPTQGVQPPGEIVDMVCSSIDEDILYVTDGNYVYKTVDGGDTFDFVARDSLEEQIKGACGITITNQPITCIDVGYDTDDNPFVFIGTAESGTVYWIGEAGYPATWTDLQLSCYGGGGYDAYAVGCAPDWADSKETFVVVSNGTDTHVISTIGVTCSWTEVAELKEDCVTSFGTQLASRIGFPDDWEETETLFAGVTGDYLNFGGDVYLVTVTSPPSDAIDLNVAGISTGCVGVIDATNIISLDIFGDTEEASLIAGVYGYVSLPDFDEGTNVYCSEDGGWSWDVSAKDPTGEEETYVLWYGDSALAATSGYECAVSLCCGEEFPCEFWNQISLIATNISCVIYGDHSPGYLSDESQTMFMLTISSSVPSQSLFRHDGTYWERVFCSTIADSYFEMVLVSPDFLTTNAVFVANSGFEIWRSLDAGCSWDKFTFPCSPRPYISAAVIIDEDTGIVGGMDGPDESSPDPDDYSGTIFKTERHGARPWNKYEVATTAGNIMSFDLEPGYEDPGTIILGDDMSQVFISEDGGETWNIVGAALLDPADGDTSVIFDPGYATNHTIYAATGNVIARCVIDPDEAWADQVWEDIGSSVATEGDVYWGIVAAGDTALYVGDKAEVYKEATYIDGGVLRSLNPDAEDAADVVFERIAEGLTVDKTRLSGLMLTTDVSDEGCAENVLWSLDLTPPEPEVYEGCKIVWTYEDTLAAPIVLNMPVDGQKLPTTHSATLSWNELCGAECYEVYLAKYCPECPEEKIEIPLEFTCPTDGAECTTAETCIVVGPGYFGPKDGLEPGMTYYWQVRVCKGHPTLSKWSEERTFMTALVAVPELCSPECGGQDIILTPNFSWDEVPEAIGYDIELATTETFTAGVVRGSSTVNAWVYGEPLEYGTTYYWRVRAEKNGIFSDWTVCIFTTIEEPVEEPPPVVVGPTPPAPVVPAPMLELPPTPIWVWAIIGIGAALAVVVIVLIVRSRRPPAQPPV